MSNDDPFTLDLIGNIALSSGHGLGAAAFGSDFGAEDPAENAPSTPAVPARHMKPVPRVTARGQNFFLDSDRGLAKGWKQRARDNLDAIRLAAEIDAEDRPATLEEQARLARFTGFGASELANAVFRRPGETAFRDGWDEIGAELEEAVSGQDYASLARCTQYAHFTPELVVRAMWSGLTRLGWRGGRVLEPGIGTGLFPALIPAQLRDQVHVTGVEIDPVTARIARLLQPRARILNADFARTDLPASFDLAIGNPPFSDRTVRSDRGYRSIGLRLHDYFIARSIDLLKPGGLAAFVTSSGTMDKADCSAREHIAKSADLVAAVRVPEGSFRADAGTEVVIDILFFRKRQPSESEGHVIWLDTEELRLADGDDGAIRVNRWFARHPDFVLGTHAVTSGPFGETSTCLPQPWVDLGVALSATIALLPEAIYDGKPDAIDLDADERIDDGLGQDLAIREGSYFIASNTALMQTVDGVSLTITVRKGRSSDGVPDKHARIIRKLIPIRDALREVLKAQELDRPWKPA